MTDEIIKLYETSGYRSYDYYVQEAIRPLVDFIISDEVMAYGNAERLNRLHHELISKDWFMTLIDLEAYIAVKDKMLADYEDRTSWTKKAIHNIARAGFFSSDRTIGQYNQDIWHLEEHRNFEG